MKKYVLGPEIIWLLFYLILILPSLLGWKISNGFDNFLETIWAWMPFFAFLTFVLWWLPSIEKNWLLLRVWLTCMVGGLYIFEKTMDAYGKTGPGVGTGYIVCAMLLFFVLVFGSIIVKIKFK